MEIKENQSICLTINQVSKEISEIGLPKAQKNILQGYVYRGIDPLLNLISSICSKYGLIILSRVIEYKNEECGTTKSGTVQWKTLMHIEYKIRHIHNDQECIVTQWGEAIDTSDKATNKATSVAYKYMAILLFKIPIVGVENEVDNFTPEVIKNDNQKMKDDIDTINSIKSMIDNCNDLASCNDLIKKPIMQQWAKWNNNELAYYLQNKVKKLGGVYNRDIKQYIEKV
jgi:hypothetical protein